MLNFSQKIEPALSVPAKQKRTLHINMEQIYFTIFFVSVSYKKKNNKNKINKIT